MKVYVVVLEDRHIDIQVEVFKDRGEAIAEAKRQAKDGCRYGEDYKEHNYDGWEFHADFSCEGDCVFVKEVELR